MSMEESISLEETNKIRISLGLKPLTDDKAPTNDKEKQAEDNYAKLRQTQTQERESKQIRDRIAKVRNRRELNASLKGATLGDALDDGDTDDIRKWVKKSKKKEKELAKKKQEELELMDKVFQGAEYTEKDLVGLKVSHDFNDMDEGEARILTLKDSRILDNEEDELQNVEMAEAERTKAINELKIKRRDYTGYDDDEFEPGKQGMKRAVLAKYDEDLEGPKQTDFRLGSGTWAGQAASVSKREEDSTVTVNKSLLSIDYSKNMETSDYLKEGDVGFKKPKTKKKHSSRRSAAVDSDDRMQVGEDIIIHKSRNLDTNFVDDDELQAALARSRKAKLQKVKKLSPDEVVKKIANDRAREQVAVNGVIKVEDGDATDRDASGITFDDTSEFVRAITYNPVPVKAEPVDPSLTRVHSKQPSPTRDVSMDRGDVAVEELEAGEVVMKEEDDDDEAMLNAIEDALKATEAEESGDTQNGDVGTSTEQTFDAGMASTLNILRQQGILAKPTGDQKDREKTQLQRDLWLADQRRRIALREMERLQSRGSNKDQAQREYENRVREQQEARENLEAFKNYKPDVNIVYYDEFGRTLTPKEAWKALSHTFHGKGSSKMKTEKRLKKIAEEKKQAAMASGDTPLSMNRAFQIRQEKAGQAHFVLSVGNRGAVPQIAEFLDAQPLSKGKTEKTKSKKKDAAKANQTLDSGIITLPAPQPVSLIDSAVPSAFTNSTSGSPAPTPKPGFSKISSGAEAAPSSQGGTPVPSDRTKVAFGFGAKRKAGDELKGTPPPKRR